MIMSGRATLTAVIVGVLAGLATPTPAHAHASTEESVPRGAFMKHHATGPFDVQLIPQKADNPYAEGAGIGRLALDKRFHGALEATSQGEMIAFRTSIADSAGYVALERVTGTLDGRAGSFVLQHSSTMHRGIAAQSITVVPDSGTEALTGLSGSMTITIAAGGAHTYAFDYDLP